MAVISSFSLSTMDPSDNFPCLQEHLPTRVVNSIKVHHLIIESHRIATEVVAAVIVTAIVVVVPLNPHSMCLLCSFSINIRI